MKQGITVNTRSRLPMPLNHLFIFICFLFYFTRFSTLDPEVHHDGVMTAMAIAVSEGRIPNKDVFAQYGPLAPLLQGLWIHFTEPSLISLRNFTALLLAATAIILIIILSRFTSKFLSWLITITWATSFPFFILPINLPWPSVITTLFALLILLLIIKAIDKNEPTPEFYFMVITASFLSCIAVFGRIHMILTVLGLGLFKDCFKEKKLKNLYLRIWAITSTVTLTVLVTLMSVFGVLLPYVNQCILWASETYVGNRLAIDKARLIDHLLLLIFPIITSTFLIGNWIVNTGKPSLLRKLLLPLLILAVAPIATIRIDHKSFLNLKYVIVYFSQNFTNWIGYVSVSFLLFWFIKGLIRRCLTPTQSAFGFFGITILAQLYPVHDSVHLYWITPVLVAVIAIWIQTDGSIFDYSRESTLKFFLLSLLTVNLILSVYNLTMPRVNYQAGSVLQGMKGNSDKVQAVQKTMDAVNLAADSGHIEFDCMDGIYSVSGGKYLPLGSNFVNWGPKVKSQRQSKYILACNLSKSEINQIAIRNKVKEIIPIDANTSNILYLRDPER